MRGICTPNSQIVYNLLYYSQVCVLLHIYIFIFDDCVTVISDLHAEDYALNLFVSVLPKI